METLLQDLASLGIWNFMYARLRMLVLIGGLGNRDATQLGPRSFFLQGSETMKGGAGRCLGGACSVQCMVGMRAVQDLASTQLGLSLLSTKQGL